MASTALSVTEQPGSEAAATPLRPQLLARDPELIRVAAFLDGASSEGAGMIMRGEPGVGKTALLCEAASRAEERGFLVLRVSGVEFEADLAFAGLHQLLRPVIGRLDALSAPQRDALGASFGMESVETPDLFLIALATLNLLSESAENAPILLVADDCQWLDRSSSRVLAFVARRLQSDPIAFIAATREDGGGPLDGVGLLELRVDPLDDAAAVALLSQCAPWLSTTLRARVLAEAAGNPLALVELPNVIARCNSDQTLAEWLPLSTHLECTFAARHQHLPPLTRSLLLVASLTDELALSENLDAASHVTNVEVTLDDLVPAVDARLVEITEGHLRFRHPLIRSAIRQAATLPERHAAHAALAATLASDPQRQVWHRAACALGPDEDIAADLDRSAAQAARRGAPLAAATALDRAAALSADPRCKAGRLLRAAELAVGLGQREMVTRLVHEAEQLELGPLERGRLALIRETFDPGIDGELATVLALVEQARSAIDHDDAALALGLLTAAAANSFWADRSAETHDAIKAEALRVDVNAEDPRLLAILAYIAPAEDVSDVVDQLAHWAGDLTLAPEELQMLGGAAFIVCAHELATNYLTASIDRLRAQGRLERLAQSLVMRAWCEIHLGRWDVAAPDAEEALGLSQETAQPIWEAGARVAQAWLAAVRGQPDLAEQLAAAAESVVVPAGSKAVFSVVELTRGVSALVAGRHTDAYQHLRRMLTPGDLANHRMTSAWAVANIAEAAAYSGSTDEARELVATLERAGERRNSTVFSRVVSHAHAVLADDEAAEGLFTTALSGELAKTSFDRARLELAFGIWLRRRRRVVEARDLLRAARATFDALGALPWGDRARQELRATGESSQRRAPDARDQLTPQELQVAQMAAEGLSNREIGQKLYLSHRTISSHLYRIFPKLGISARSELAAVLAGERFTA
jgi:DNA-binding CsgD family transcriptional regulator